MHLERFTAGKAGRLATLRERAIGRRDTTIVLLQTGWRDASLVLLQSSTLVMCGFLSSTLKPPRKCIHLLHGQLESADFSATSGVQAPHDTK